MSPPNLLKKGKESQLLPGIIDKSRWQKNIKCNKLERERCQQTLNVLYNLRCLLKLIRTLSSKVSNGNLNIKISNSRPLLVPKINNN